MSRSPSLTKDILIHILKFLDYTTRVKCVKLCKYLYANYREYITLTKVNIVTNQIIKEYYMDNQGKKQGRYTMYNYGSLSKEYHYLDGKKHGLCVDYWHDNQTISRTTTRVYYNGISSKKYCNFSGYSKIKYKDIRYSSHDHFNNDLCIEYDQQQFYYDKDQFVEYHYGFTDEILSINCYACAYYPGGRLKWIELEEGIRDFDEEGNIKE